jgi:predicted CopG family antitoxin
VTKQVALADRTYARLRGTRHPGESFSDVIERLLDTFAKDPLSFPKSTRSRTNPEARLERIRADRDDSTVDA